MHRTRCRRNGSNPTDISSTRVGSAGARRRSNVNSNWASFRKEPRAPRCPPWVQDWESLPPAERALYARMQEVFAGFLTHTDHQIGRLVSALETRGLLDNTMILLLSDNGASAEGSSIGSINEGRFTLGLDRLEDNLANIDELGGTRLYNHYAWGWAWAGNTPFRLWKRYTWLGGTRVPLVVHWPDGIETGGEVRSQFCHVIDLMPTVLDACGVVPSQSSTALRSSRSTAPACGRRSTTLTSPPRDTCNISRSSDHARCTSTVGRRRQTGSRGVSPTKSG